MTVRLLPIPLLLVFVLGACDDGGESVKTDCSCPGPYNLTCPDGGAPITPDAVTGEPDGTVPDLPGGESLAIAVKLEGEIVSGLTKFEATVEGGAAILGVEFYVDAVRIDTDLIPPYSATVNTTDFPDGVHYVVAFTADSAGETASDSLSVTFDNTPPVILTTTPAEGDSLFFEDGPLALEFTVDDPAAIKEAIFRANGLLVGEFAAPPFVGQAEWADLFIDETVLPKNIYLQFSATDYLGQVAETSLNVMVYQRLFWTFETVGEIWGSAVALNNGNIAFGNSNHEIFCLNPQGGLVWQASVDQQVIEAPAVDPSSNQTFFGTVNGTVYSYNAGGSQLWSQSLGTPVGGDLVFSNNTLYVSGFNGTLFALNASSGSTTWTANLPSQIMGSPGVAPDGRAYVGCQDKKLYAVQNGSILWSIPTGGEVWSTPAVAVDQSVYFGSNDGWLYAVSSGGQSKWVQEVQGQLWGKPLLSDDGFVYVSSTSKYVTKYDANGGTKIWSTKTEGISNSSPVLDEDGMLYVGTTGGRIFALDAESGEVQWTYQVGNTIHATPLIRDGQLLFGSTDRNFYSLRLAPPAS